MVSIKSCRQHITLEIRAKCMSYYCVCYSNRKQGKMALMADWKHCGHVSYCNVNGSKFSKKWRKYYGVSEFLRLEFSR